MTMTSSATADEQSEATAQPESNNDPITSEPATMNDEAIQTSANDEESSPSPLFARDSTTVDPSSSPTGGLEEAPGDNIRSVRFSLRESPNDTYDDANDPITTTTAAAMSPSEEDPNSSHYSKQRTTTTSDQTVGVTQVDERAPNINLRFFRGLGNRGRSRRRRAREEQQQQQGDAQPLDGNERNVRPMSNILLQSNRNLPSTSNTATTRSNRLLSSLSHSRFFSSTSTPTSSNNNPALTGNNDDSMLISATLVEETELEYAIAEEMNYCQTNAKWLLPLLCFVLLALIGGVSAGVVIAQQRNQFKNIPSEVPSPMPSMAPSMDRRPTIINIQERGYIRCGLSTGSTPELLFRRELCRAIAAVVLGHPDKYQSIDPFVTFGGRWNGLQKGGIDLQITGDTHTVQREVEEELTFSTPYQYDGASYNGNATYVRCAYELKRYEECQELYICVLGGTTMTFVSTHFSPEFYHESHSWEDVFEWYKNGTCNVIAGDRQAAKVQMEEANLTEYVIGNETVTNEPLAIVTRNDESEWSDVVNWVMISMFRGEDRGMGRNDTLCEKDESIALPSIGSELNYNNAVYCVGNYREVFEQWFGEGDQSYILGSQQDVLYVTPFGQLYDENAENEPPQVIDSLMHNFHTSPLKCGIVIQDGCENGNITVSDNICGMSVDLCRTLAASIFYGNVDDLNITVYPNENSALVGLSVEESVDVVMGMKWSFDSDFGTESVKGVTFSRPFLYGDETEE